jgi:integrase
MVHLYGFAIATGARRAEILGLRWSDIDFENKKVLIQRGRTRAKGTVNTDSPKTRTSFRRLPLSPNAEAFLVAQREMVEKERAELGAGMPDVDWVFVDRFGRPLDPDYVRQRYIRDVKRAPVRRIRFHDLRHTFATNALAAGANVKAVSEWLGHSNVQTTLSFYSHVLPALEAEAARVVDAALFGKPDLEQEPGEDDGDPDVTRDVT